MADDVCRKGERRNQSYRLIKTAVLFLSWICLGLYNEVVGPTLPDLKERSGSNYEEISRVLSARSAGLFIGSIVGGAVHDRWARRRDLILAMALLVSAVTIAVAPWCSSLWVLGVVFHLMGQSHGLLTTGANPTLAILWADRSAGPFNFMHSGFGLGGTIGPLISRPFMSPFHSSMEATNDTATSLDPLSTDDTVMFSTQHNTTPAFQFTTSPFKLNTTSLFQFNTSFPIQPNTTSPLQFNTTYPFQFSTSLSSQLNTTSPFQINTTSPFQFNRSLLFQLNTTFPLQFKTTFPFQVSNTSSFQFNTASLLPAQFQSQIEIPYGIVGVLCCVMSLAFLTLFVLRLPDQFAPKEVPWREIVNPRTCARGQTVFGIQMLALMFLYYMFVVGGERAFGKFVFSFAIESRLHLTKEQASWLTAAYWICFTVARLLTFFATRCIPIHILLFVEISGTLVSAIFLNIFPESLPAFWLLSMTFGFFKSPLFPSCLGWANRYIDLNSMTIMCVNIGSSTGGMLVQWLTGYLFQYYGPNSFLYLIVAYSIAIFILFIVMHYVASRHGNKYSRGENGTISTKL